MWENFNWFCEALIAKIFYLLDLSRRSECDMRVADRCSGPESVATAASSAGLGDSDGATIWVWWSFSSCGNTALCLRSKLGEITTLIIIDIIKFFFHKVFLSVILLILCWLARVVAWIDTWYRFSDLFLTTWSRLTLSGFWSGLTWSGNWFATSIFGWLIALWFSMIYEIYDFSTLSFLFLHCLQLFLLKHVNLSFVISSDLRNYCCLLLCLLLFFLRYPISDGSSSVCAHCGSIHQSFR